VLTRALDARLRADFPNAFAGFVRASDGALEVYSTGDPALAALVHELQPESGGSVPVRVVTGMTNSLMVLERLHEQVRARAGELKARGIVLGSFGVDVRRNRYRLAVVDLTPEKAALLTAAFGADQVEVVQGGLWAPLVK
ncbi:MAG: hypothetical protein M3O80_06050, partial [Chloroflexota bacterium]|nr:hypothetical protein [Chloroflexota bacterium]